MAISWTHVDPLMYALPVAAILYVAVSLATKPLEEKHLDKVFEGFPGNGRKDKKHIVPAK